MQKRVIHLGCSTVQLIKRYILLEAGPNVPFEDNSCSTKLQTKDIVTYYRLPGDNNVVVIHLLVKCNDSIIRRYSVRATLDKDTDKYNIRPIAYLDE